MALHAVGSHTPGSAERLGDGAGTTPTTRARALGLSYAVTAVHPTVGLVYAVQGAQHNRLGLSYLVSAPATQFTLNGRAVVAPSQLTYVPPSAVQQLVDGRYERQGEAGVVWSYALISDADLVALLSDYTPADPRVTISYPDALGRWRLVPAVLQPPTWGQRTTLFTSGLRLTFTRIRPD